MQIRITLQPVRDCFLWDSYRSSVQGLIYHLLQRSDQDYAHFLHEEGYPHPDKVSVRFKQFCFSGLHDSALRHPRRFHGSRDYRLFQEQVYSLVFSSPKKAFTQNVLFGIFQEQQAQNQQIHLNECWFHVVQVELLSLPDLQGKEGIVLTPFHSGFIAKAPLGILPPGHQFLTLNEKELLEKQLLDGLRMRVKEHHDTLISAEACRLKFLESGLKNQHIRKFPVVQNRSRHHIIATHCDLELTGPKELLEMAFLTGIGEKGTLGMGMVRLKEQKISAGSGSTSRQKLTLN